jgi:hypothetical protein
MTRKFLGIKEITVDENYGKTECLKENNLH